MMNHSPLKSPFLGLGLLLLMTACSSHSPELKSGTPQNEDTSISEETIANTYSSTDTTRVIALTSLSADIIQQLDSNKLIAIPGSRLLANNPAFEALPKISQGRTLPNLENIAALKPDLVIGAQGFHDTVLKKVEDLGIQTLSTQVDSWEELESLTQELATKLDSDASGLLARYEQCQSNLASSNKSVLMLVSHQPILVPNKESWAGELLDTFNYQNPVADLQGASPVGGYVTLSEEKVLQTNPDIIIVVNADPTTLDTLEAKSFWQKLKATQNNQVFQADYFGMVNPGSLESIEKACEQLRSFNSQ